MSKRQKLCLVLPSHWASNFGGAEYQVSLLLEELLKIESLDVVYLARHVSEAFIDTRYTVKKIKPFPFLLKLGFWVDAISLLKHLYREKPDVIYQRVGCAYTGICAFFARRTGCRMIWHISIDSDLSSEIGRFPIGSRLIERGIRDFGIRSADSIIAQTDEQARALSASYDRHAIVIRNFQPAPAQTSKKAAKPTVIWVANLKPAKRPEAYLRVVALVPESLNVDFVMVGRGGDKGAYARLIDETQKDSGLSYLGERPIAEVDELVSRAHILVNTSMDEGFPNTFIQAWYRHTLVVTMSVDPDGILTRKSCGFVCNSVEEIAQTIQKIVLDEALRSAMTNRAFDYVSEEHDLKNAKLLAAFLTGDK